MTDDASANKRYFDELMREDIALNEAVMALERAQMEVRLAKDRYRAVRDMVTEWLHTNPYAPNSPARQFLEPPNDFPTHGKFRFYGMSVPDAAYMALRETGEPMTIDELAAALVDGGIGVPDNQLKRGVNAGLMNHNRVNRREDGRFELKPLTIVDLPLGTYMK